MSDGVTTRRDGHILEVTLERGKVNAIDVPTSQALAEAFKELHEDKNLRCAILTGGGEKIFSAGWDLKALNDGEMQLDNWWEVDEYGFGGFTGLTENWVLNKPVIAAVNGLAIGGGFEMAMGCDLLIAADHVEFGLPEMPLGIVPDAGALQRLPRQTGAELPNLEVNAAPVPCRRCHNTPTPENEAWVICHAPPTHETRNAAQWLAME